jgi:signal transduction histidine kinase
MKRRERRCAATLMDGKQLNSQQDSVVARRGRRIAMPMRIGLEGKILCALMFVLISSMGATCWVWASRTRVQVNDIMGEQARQIAYTLTLTAKKRIASANSAGLRFLGSDLLNTRNILFVAFYDAQGRNIAISHRDPEFQTNSPWLLQADVQSLTRVQRAKSPIFGDFVQITTPVLDSPADGSSSSGAGSRLIGYITVGVSSAAEEAKAQGANIRIAVGIGCFIILLSLPLAYGMVYRIFMPIRQLVGASRAIAAGDLDARVAIDRVDAIGELARAFNEMVQTVKRQREDLQRANQRLEEANSDLEKKVVQRTGQLEMANKRLSSEIAEKEDFLRAVSHDLNAPLRNISGMASMLLLKHREKFDADVIHRLERIQKNVEVETDLIGELLELSRIKTRRQKMEMVEFSALVRDLGDIFENDLKSRRIVLCVDNPLPVVNCEKARFRQVFQNLIDNAIKYMGDGPVREIHVGCAVRRGETEFYVRDTGLGIDPEDIDRIFFVFRRGKNSAASNIAGKGVGLSSVKAVIEMYNGKIWVESKPGKGSVFKFTVNGQYVSNAQRPTGQTKQAQNANSSSKEPV